MIDRRGCAIEPLSGHYTRAQRRLKEAIRPRQRRGRPFENPESGLEGQEQNDNRQRSFPSRLRHATYDEDGGMERKRIRVYISIAIAVKGPLGIGRRHENDRQSLAVLLARCAGRAQLEKRRNETTTRRQRGVGEWGGAGGRGSECTKEGNGNRSGPARVAAEVGEVSLDGYKGS